MPAKPVKIQIFSVLRSSVNSLLSNPVIFLPFMTVAFFQLLILEILLFAPRFPLSIFFGPILKYYGIGDVYMHYPFNLLVLPRMYHFVYIPLYLLLGSFLIGVAVNIITALNNDKKVSFKKAIKETMPKYLHIITGAGIAYATFYLLYSLHGLTIMRALKIKSETGTFFMLKSFVLHGTPFVHLLIGVFVTALFAYVFPIIIIENKKVFAAIGENFRSLWGYWWFTFFIVLIPMIFYTPILLLRNNIAVFADKTFPDLRFYIIVIGIVIMTFIDAIVYTAITMSYLTKRELK